MNPIDRATGVIVDYDERTGEAIIKATVSREMLLHRQYERVSVQFIDSRQRSLKQLRSCYAMIGAIAEYVGESKDEMNDILKVKFWNTELYETADGLFSLSDAPMSIVSAYQRWLAGFILRHDIPTKLSLLSYVDDVQDYVYQCLINKKCCVCGKKADLHHVDRVGMGRDREDIIHEGLEAMPLCREHHNEVHMLGQDSFNDKYHLSTGIVIDKTICRIYGLKEKK